MTRTAFLVGGPRDGEWLAVQGNTRHIAYATMTEHEPWAEALIPYEVRTETHSYVAQIVGLFGMQVTVWVWDQLNESERDTAVARHLLSDVAFRLVKAEATGD